MQQMYNISFTKKNKQKRPTKASDYGRRHNGMAESTVTADSKLTSSDTRRRIWAIVGASSGNLVEWFDFYVYSFCSLYFAHIFFPSGNTTTQLLQTAGVFAAGFLMRPIGGWLFGRIADKHGRKKSMLLSVCMMCFGSLVIACLPGYETIGTWAPALLLLARLFQGLSVGGEYGTSATYMSEVAVEGRKGFYASFQYVTLIGGQLLALLVVVVLQHTMEDAALREWGWRIPFALGAVLAVVALWLRRQLDETSQQETRALKEAGSLKGLWRNRRAFIMVLGFTAAGSLCFYTFTTYMQKYLVNTAGMHANVASGIMTAALFVFMLIQPLIGAASNTNADWYCRMAQENPGVDVPVYGVPINTREALGVLHFKGFIIDDSVLYSGASLNDVYLHQHDKYRYDRYHLIRNRKMSDIMFEWVTQNIMNGRGVNRLDDVNRPKSPEIKNDIRLFRQELRDAAYHFQGDADNDQLSVTPLVGLGKSSLLNKTIFHLMPCAEQKLTICTPYFNLPAILVRNIIQLLREGKKVEIIVGDKTANDFYIPEDEPFKIIGALPYLYEINLRRFLSRLQYYVNTDQLVVRLWKDDDNTYHLKGMWVDDKWMLITGNNLNPRAWRLDLENAILIHDPQLELAPQREKELELIREHTTIVKHYRDLQSIADYPVKVRKLIRRLRRIRIDRLISRIL
jgi:CDP-diacylglycerol---serine O-phosphatidyltransferase